MVTLRSRTRSLRVINPLVTYPYRVSGRRFLRALGATASGGVLAVTVAAGSVTLAANHLTSNVTKIDISEQVGERSVDFGDLSSGPVTFLLMGSDSRSGAGNRGYGSFDGARSDTTMLVHVYPDRDSAVVVSIPRDTVMDLPSCKDSAGRTIPGTRARFNTAFENGGPGCTVKAVEAMSGLQVDHFVVLDFNGFKRAVDALGGVEVCLTRPLVDRQSKVDLPAGRTRVYGDDALAFVRVRHNIGDGSDISRIGRQQLFLSSLIQEVSTSGLMTDPTRLWRVLNESTKALAMDPGLADAKALLALGNSLRGLSPSNISFVTLPWQPSGDGATVVVNQASAKKIWHALATESPWPEPPTTGVDGQALAVAPSAVTVSVRNASGTQGEGSRAMRELRAQGFRIATVGSASTTRATTVIRHTSAQLEAARTLQAAVPGARLKEVAGTTAVLDLRLGSDFTHVSPIVMKKRATSANAPSGTPTTADQDICTG